MSGQRLGQIFEKKKKKMCAQQSALIQIYIIFSDLFFVVDIFGVQFLRVN